MPNSEQERDREHLELEAMAQYRIPVDPLALARYVLSLAERVERMEAWAHEPFDFGYLIDRLTRVETSVERMESERRLAEGQPEGAEQDAGEVEREALRRIMHEYETAGNHGADAIDVIYDIARSALRAVPSESQQEPYGYVVERRTRDGWVLSETGIYPSSPLIPSEEYRCVPLYRRSATETSEP